MQVFDYPLPFVEIPYSNMNSFPSTILQRVSFTSAQDAQYKYTLIDLPFPVSDLIWNAFHVYFKTFLQIQHLPTSRHLDIYIYM